MKGEEIIRARKAAEASVADMPEGDLKVAAFQTILSQLLQQGRELLDAGPIARPKERRKAPSGTTSRLISLIDEGVFAERRSLTAIREILAQRGWHYRLEDLGTPLTRLVRRKHLRRIQVTESGKKLWHYSNY
jgi:hypothetical protein